MHVGHLSDAFWIPFSRIPRSIKHLVWVCLIILFYFFNSDVINVKNDLLINVLYKRKGKREDDQQPHVTLIYINYERKLVHAS